MKKLRESNDLFRKNRVITLTKKTNGSLYGFLNEKN